MSTTVDLARQDGVLELFCGAGGFSWGIRQAGLRTLAAVDINTAAARTHELNFGGDHCLTLNRDLTRFGPEQLEPLLGQGRTPPLAVVGGPPCQGWSRAGRGKLRSLRVEGSRLIDDPRNTLYRQFVRYVRHFGPPFCVMENVPGMLRLEGRNAAAEVAEDLSRVGYRVSFAVVNARWFGVPQDRRRIIFLGVRDDLPYALEADGLEEFSHFFHREIAGLTTPTVLRHAIGDLPAIEHGAREDPIPYRPTRRGRSGYVRLMREVSNGLLTDHVCRAHNEDDVEAFSILPEGGLYEDLPNRLKRYRTDIFPDKYRKLKWDDVAGTITAHLAKDCYQHIHPGQSRTISIREAARIQSFPDDFRFYGNMGERFSQIGNAVPPLMAWGLAEYVTAAVRRAGT